MASCPSEDYSPPSLEGTAHLTSTEAARDMGYARDSDNGCVFSLTTPEEVFRTVMRQRVCHFSRLPSFRLAEAKVIFFWTLNSICHRDALI